jgi:hypothetical protein
MPRARAAIAAAVATLIASPLAAQVVIKVSDTVNFKLGVLLQPQADWSEVATGGYQQNLFLRRARLLFGGQVAKDVSFFVETDAPNLGKTVAGEKNISPSIVVQDAYVEWKLADQVQLDGGLMFVPLCRNCYQSAGTLLPIDYGAYSFLQSPFTESVVGRDAGFQVRGYLASSRLEYRLAVLQGAREASSRNALRFAGRLQYAFLDPESGFFGTGTYLGKKKVLTLGAGYDVQSDYKAFAADAYFDRPVGGAGAVTIQGDYIHYDGGSTFALREQDDFLLEAGYLFTGPKLMPWVKVDAQRIRADAGVGETRFQVGLSYFHEGHHVNVKAGYGVIDREAGPSLNLFTIQLQVFYF